MGTLTRLPNGAKVAQITLEHPPSRNALTALMGEQFRDAINRIRSDQAIRAVVITGAGSAFSAGGDVTFLQNRISDTRDGNIAEMRAFYDRFLCLRTLPIPVIAAINGHAIGAGFCVALACDFRVVSEKARLALNFTRLGIHPGMGATYTLPRLIGHSEASRIILTGQEVSPEAAKHMGIAHEVVPTDQVMPEAMKLAEAVCTASPVAVSETVMTLRGCPEALAAALQREAEAQATCYAQGRDLKEALAALKEKRSATFKVA